LSVTLCIVAKRCVLEQKLPLRAYRKYARNWLTFVLRHIRHWISRKPLEIKAWFQGTTNMKWPMDYQMVTWSMTSR